MSERPRFSQREAAAACAVSLSTIRRRREAGDFPGATRDPTRGWLIPLEDLLAAGLKVNAPAPPESALTEQPAEQAVSERQLRDELTEERVRRAAAEAEAKALREMLARQDRHLEDVRAQVRMLTAGVSEGERPAVPAQSALPEQPNEQPVSEGERPRSRWWSPRSAKHRRR